MTATEHSPSTPRPPAPVNLWDQDGALKIASPGATVDLHLPGFSVNHTSGGELGITASWSGPDGPVQVRLRRGRAEPDWALPLDFGGDVRVDATLRVRGGKAHLSLPGIFAQHVWSLAPQRVPDSAQGKQRRRGAARLPAAGVWTTGVGPDVHHRHRLHVTPALMPGAVLLGGSPVLLVQAQGGLAALLEMCAPDVPEGTGRQAHITSLDGGASWALHDPGQGGCPRGLTRQAYLHAVSRAAEHQPGRWPDCAVVLDHAAAGGSNLIITQAPGSAEETVGVFALLPVEERGPFTVRAHLSHADGTAAGSALIRVGVGTDGHSFMPDWNDLITPRGELLNVAVIEGAVFAAAPAPTAATVRKIASLYQTAQVPGQFTGDHMALAQAIRRLLTRYSPQELAYLGGLIFGEAALRYVTDRAGELAFWISAGSTDVLRVCIQGVTWTGAVQHFDCRGNEAFAQSMRLCDAPDARRVVALLMQLNVLFVSDVEAVTLTCGP